MRRSEVFGEFVKIAKEKGLISEANPDHAEHTEQNTKSPRWDSLDLSAIEALYGVKPEQSKGMDYDNNIMEVAHPEPEVIAPSYDRLNGLVENEMEAQNIKLHIIKKTPDGFLMQRKYAEKELLLSLVRIANDMDNKDKEELRLLADTCLGQLHRQQGFRKEAIIPLLIGAAVILGITYLVEHMPDVDRGIRENYENLMSALSNMKNTDMHPMLFGRVYDQTLQQDIDTLITELQNFWTTYEEVLPLLQKMEEPTTPQDVIQQVKDPNLPTVIQAYESLRAAISEFVPRLEKMAANFQNPDYKSEHIQDEGAVTSLVEKIPYLEGGKGSLVADPFDVVVDAIPPFQASIKRLLDTLVKAKSIEDQAKQDLSKAKSQQVSWVGTDPFAGGLGGGSAQPFGTPTKPQAVPVKQKTVQDLDQEAESLNQALEQAGINI